MLNVSKHNVMFKLWGSGKGSSPCYVIHNFKVQKGGIIFTSRCHPGVSRVGLRFLECGGVCRRVNQSLIIISESRRH